MPRRRNLNSKQDARFHIDTGKDKGGLDVKFISDFKGRGVFACVPFEKGDFLLEYCGELISKQECERRVRVYHDALKHFMFEFRFDGKLWCVDAAKEDGSLGRLVNDDHINPNAKIKYLSIQGKPHLCLFAIRDINPGDEITYNYGDSDWPWRGKESGMKSSNDQRDYTPSTSKLTTMECLSTAHMEELTQKQPATEMPPRDAGDAEQCMERGHSSIYVSQSEQSPEFEPQPSSVEQPATEIPPRDAGDAEQCMERGHSSIYVSQSEQSPEFEPQPSSVEQPATEIPPRDAGDAEQCMERGHSSIYVSQSEQSPEFEPQPSSVEQPATEIPPRDAGDAEQCMERGHSSIYVSQSEQSPEFEPQPSSVEQPATEIPPRDAGDAEQCMERGHSSIYVSQSEQSPEFEPQPSSVEQPATEIPPRDAGDAEQCMERGHSSIYVSQSEQSPEFEPQPSSVEQPATEIPPRDAGDAEQCPKHRLVCGDMSAFDKCSHCLGPFASLRWTGYKCKDCPGLWHLSCYRRMTGQDSSDLDESMSSGSEYVPDSESGDSDSDSSIPLVPHRSKVHSCQIIQELSSDTTSTVLDTSIADDADASKCWQPLADDIDDAAVDPDSTAGHMDVDADETSGSAVSKQYSSNRQLKNKRSYTSTHSSFTNRNYCFVCGKPQSRLTRHLKTHMSHPEVSYAFYLPEKSKERKVLFEKMRNKGNFKHNSAILQGETGQLKVKRKPKVASVAGNFVHCMHCLGLYIRKELWRHVRRCPCRPDNKDPEEQIGRTRVLALATAQETVFSQHFSSGMWKILSSMKVDEVGLTVRNDLSIVHFAQSLYNRHGQDTTKHEYMRQKLREVGRLLVCLRRDFSIHSLEEAIKPSNFQNVVQAVQKVAGFDEEKLSYRTPSLALKLGHTLHKICDIIHCRALMAEDDRLVKSAETFSKLYTSKWCELVSHSALNTLSSAKYNKPATLPFTEDVRTLHQYLQKSADAAVSSLTEEATSKTYAELSKVILAQIILFNRRRAGEVSKMLLRSFEERDRTKLHQDVAMALSKLEQQLCSYFTRVEIVGKRERKVVVLLTPCMVDALSLLTSKRKECGVHDNNVFLFGRPQALSHYRGQDCLRVYASQCGAKHPELLRSTQLRKHVATLSQILNLKNNELDQVADFLGHDIRVHRDFYRLPVPTMQLAKISKLLLSMEKGNLSGLKGKSLDEIEIEDEISFSDTEAKDSGSDSEDSSTEANGPQPEDMEGLGQSSGCHIVELSQNSEDLEILSEVTSTARETTPQSEGKNAVQECKARSLPKKMWSKAEVAAVMRHFGIHISQGKLASKAECSQCKEAEDPVLSQRTIQNIRDFVRNRITTTQREAKRKL